MSQKRKQRPWTPEARANHLAGCRKYQKERKEWEYFTNFVDLAQRLEVDTRDLLATVLVIYKAKKEGFGSAPTESVKKEEPSTLAFLERNKKFVQDLVAVTMRKIKEGIIPDPIQAAGQRKGVVSWE